MAVCDWREYTARKKDKPRSWIIDDKACFELAQTAPQNRDQLQTLLPPPAARRYGDELLALLAQQGSLPDSELPERLPPPLNGEQRNQLKKVKQASRNIAQTLGMAPEAVLPSKDYELLVREASGQAVNTPDQWNGWRKDCIVDPLRQLLNGT